jgi:hypothetical protein
MSAASLLSVYDGANPAVLVVAGAGGAGATPTLAAVLQVGNSAGVDDIDMNGKSLLDLLDLTGTTTALLEINSGAGQGVKVEGAVGASLVSGGASGCAVTAGGALTLTAATAQPDGLVLAGAGLVPTASLGPNIIVTHIISFKAGATTYWLPVLSAAPTA